MDRFAIFGGSFGGYTALAGAAFESEIYRCAIGYAGVYDWVQQMKAGKNCEMIINNWGVHGLPKESKRIEFYVSVAQFLQRHM